MSVIMPRGPENDEGPAPESVPPAVLARAFELVRRPDPPLLVGLVLVYAITQGVAADKVMVLTLCAVAPVIIWRVLQRLRWG
ncbi:hypothetical protein ACFRMQ_11055 [Kitasatospora sp. NPDC056783]|uniref:hypothetical protein n=1 Tax=Kitasatospora sp. NPDC056783 TaxID=3345943 RepID=UPI0036C6AED2